MADFPAALQPLSVPEVFGFPTRIPARHARPRHQNIPAAVEELTSVGPSTYVNSIPAPAASLDYLALRSDIASYAFDFFEKFHVSPASFAFGNILTTTNTAVSVYSAYRYDNHTWTSFVNNAGDGVTLLGLPSLPVVIGPQTGVAGLTLEVTPNGPPKVDTTLDFVFDTMIISPTITAERLVLWSVLPNLPYTEIVQFTNRVLEMQNGTEQRINLRATPQQFFEWTMLLEPGPERARIHNLLFDWQARVFGVPIWHESTFPSAAIAVSDTVITVRSTSFADYREGGLVLLFDTNTGTNDAMEIAVGGITSTTLTFTNPVLNAYSTGALVCPLRTGRMSPTVSGSRFSTDAAKLKVRFEVVGSGTDLSDDTAWAHHPDGKVLVDDPNIIRGSLSEQFVRDIVVIDNIQGLSDFSTNWDKGKRKSAKTFSSRTPQKTWEIRQLIHFLRGRQVSFYLPTFGKDFVPYSDLVSGSTTLTVINVGFDRYINQRRPYSWIRIIFTDTVTNPSLIRQITGSSEVDAASENLTLDGTWPAAYSPADVERIEFLELVRFDSDVIRFKYAEGDRSVSVTSPVITLFD